MGSEGVNDAEIDMVLVRYCVSTGKVTASATIKAFTISSFKRCRPDCLKIGLGYFPPEAAIDD